MSLDTADDDLDVEPEATSPVALRRVLICVIAVAVLVVAAAAGWLVGDNSNSGSSTPGVNSVDAGFARDMSTHHTQAVTMATYELENTDSSQMRVLAYDILTEQQFQIGEMSGWLDTWGLSRVSADQMAWMGMGVGPAPALMPGMATDAEMTHLQSLHGKALDIDFLQLMIRHHQGGVQMAQYAAAHASKLFVRNTAQSMVTQQSNEIVQMEQMLRQLGAQALPAPN